MSTGCGGESLTWLVGVLVYLLAAERVLAHSNQFTFFTDYTALQDMSSSNKQCYSKCPDLTLTLL